MIKKKIRKHLKEAIYDPGDTVPVRGVDPNGDDPCLAIKELELKNLGPNNTIIDTFTPDEKVKLRKMIKNGEFTQLEAAVLHSLMSEAGTLEDIGAMIGSVSRRTKGEPTSKPGAIKEINRILEIVAKRSKAKFGKEVDLNQIRVYKSEMKKNAEMRRKAALQARIRANKAEREFYRLRAELHREQVKHGLPQSKYYVRYRAPSDKNIDQMKQFGGKSDFDND